MSNKLSIVIAAHGQGDYLPGILNSIAMQRQYRTGTSTKGEPYNYEAGARFTKPNIEVIICWDGIPDMSTIDTIDLWDEFPFPPVKIIECAPEGGVGHHTREPGIKAATGDWIVCTNQDNFFMHGWLHSVTQCLLPQYGLVYWDIVSNLHTWKANPASIAWGQVDLSSVCIRAEFAKKIGFPFRNYDGDWDYINACSKLSHQAGLRQVHIPEVLGVHN